MERQTRFSKKKRNPKEKDKVQKSKDPQSPRTKQRDDEPTLKPRSSENYKIKQEMLNMNPQNHDTITYDYM